eukprot:760848-Hanusia_phi.AAC.2
MKPLLLVFVAAWSWRIGERRRERRRGEEGRGGKRRGRSNKADTKRDSRSGGETTEDGIRRATTNAGIYRNAAQRDFPSHRKGRESSPGPDSSFDRDDGQTQCDKIHDMLSLGMLIEAPAEPGADMQREAACHDRYVQD